MPEHDNPWQPHLDKAIALKQGDEAEAEARAAIATAPDKPDCLFTLAWVLQNAGKLEQARDAYTAAIELDAHDPRFWNNLGNVLRGLGAYEDALRAASETLRLKPNHPGAWLTRGDACKALGRLEDALVAYKTGHIQTPDHIELAYGLADVLLTTGDFENGWKAYEARWRLNRMGDDLTARYALANRWTGQSFDGKTLLVMSEQGLGDTLQFCRYLPLIKALGGQVIFEVQKPLESLMVDIIGADDVIARGDPVPDHDFLIPLLSIPGVLGTTMATIPARIPYLKVPSGHVVKWAALRRDLKGMKVGLVWAGGTDHAGDRRRSLSLTDLAPVLDIEGISFVSLQVGPPKNDLETASRTIIDAGAQFKDFSDTAGALMHLDLIISVDTSVAHLAGALGKPVWTLIPSAPDWRWMQDCADTLWYPTMTLYRQQPNQTWKPVVESIANDLIDRVSSMNKLTEPENTHV